MVRLVKTKNSIKQCCLAASVRPYQTTNPTVINVQTYPIDSIDTTKVFTNFLYF